MENGWKPKRVVIIEFTSRAKVTEFLSDPDAKNLFKLRHESIGSRVILVDGCSLKLSFLPLIISL